MCCDRSKSVDNLSVLIFIVCPSLSEHVMKLCEMWKCEIVGYLINIGHEKQEIINYLYRLKKNPYPASLIFFIRWTVNSATWQFNFSHNVCSIHQCPRQSYLSHVSHALYRMFTAAATYWQQEILYILDFDVPTQIWSERPWDHLYAILWRSYHQMALPWWHGESWCFTKTQEVNFSLFGRIWLKLDMLNFQPPLPLRSCTWLLCFAW